MQITPAHASENIEPNTGAIQLSDRDLQAVAAGGGGVMMLQFTFKLVAVKTVSWAHD